ncbi:MAG: hypothetical protein IJ806_01365 [Ruminococcus sp.]|nr:hypothetical protein [Ruminococcus sp.]
MDRFDRMDCDNFIVGTQEELKPFEYDMRKVREYMKLTGKSFADLSEDELKRFKTDENTV